MQGVGSADSIFLIRPSSPPQAAGYSGIHNKKNKNMYVIPPTFPSKLSILKSYIIFLYNESFFDIKVLRIIISQCRFVAPLRGALCSLEIIKKTSFFSGKLA